MISIVKALDFLNLIDDNGRLSITNIALIGLLCKLSFSTNVDWPSVVAVITAFGNYGVKRVVNSGIFRNDTSTVGQVSTSTSNPAS